MEQNKLIDQISLFMSLAAENNPSSHPTLPIPPTTNAEVAGVPEQNKSKHEHCMRENRELKGLIALLLDDPYANFYDLKQLKELVHAKTYKSNL